MSISSFSANAQALIQPHLVNVTQTATEWATYAADTAKSAYGQIPETFCFSQTEAVQVVALTALALSVAYNVGKTLAQREMTNYFDQTFYVVSPQEPSVALPLEEAKA